MTAVVQKAMDMHLAFTHLFTSSPSLSSLRVASTSPLPSFKLSTNFHGNITNKALSLSRSRSRIAKIRATLDDTPQTIPEQPNKRVEESVLLLRYAAITRKVPAKAILYAFSVIEKAKVDPSGFLDTLGGSESPGRTWMLIFTAEKKLKGGRYFPITAVQRFDAAAKRLENGVYFGRLGFLTFEGPFSWKNRILAFIYERIRIKIGPFPLEFSLGQKGDREPSSKEDPFFTWLYIDNEIAVARGRSGGTAFWGQCRAKKTT